jgi:uncharacterized protein YfaT (DUF1175 family)
MRDMPDSAGSTQRMSPVRSAGDDRYPMSPRFGTLKAMLAKTKAGCASLRCADSFCPKSRRSVSSRVDQLKPCRHSRSCAGVIRAAAELGLKERAYKYLEQGVTSAGNPRPEIPRNIELAIAELARRARRRRRVRAL